MEKKRLTELEIRVTFQEKLIEELNEVLIKQQSQLDCLQKDLDAVREQLRLLPFTLAPSGDDPLPPHY
ncbi:MAG: hypothetical protein A2521_11510 [Deltaproteobacteria bacterium RIFOXYD12_FULL_57_12]|nr:MAG: hypothetical protein A2521_11510 [Deltaproteobacteria bacterium RIFOXYD12_FULL_57_12]